MMTWRERRGRGEGGAGGATRAGAAAPRGAAHRRGRPALLLSALVLPALLLAGCAPDPWTQNQRTEAVRLCRDQFGFPPVSIFETADVAFVRFMCQCEVDWLAERIPYRRFEDRLRVSEVNKLLSTAGVHCLQQLKEQGKY